MGFPATSTNQLIRPARCVYDGNGNPTTVGCTTLTWDVENRMTAHGTALEAAYRGDGLRAWKEGATRTYFLYDGINVVCELDAVGDLLAASTFGAAGLLSRGEVQYQFDPLGDAVHLLDATGDVTANRLFDAWGSELTSGDFNPRGYRAKYGYYTDEETGLIALAYRYYAPGVGRFLSRDPISFAAGPNLFVYARNHVVTAVELAGWILCENGISAYMLSLCASEASDLASLALELALALAGVKAAQPAFRQDWAGFAEAKAAIMLCVKGPSRSFLRHLRGLRAALRAAQAVVTALLMQYPNKVKAYNQCMDAAEDEYYANCL